MQQLSNPAPLTPSSMQSGGFLGDDKGPREMTAPGSDPVTGPPVAGQVSSQRLPEPIASGADVSREVMTDAGGATRPGLPRDPGSGRFTPVSTTVKGPAGRWRLTSAAG